MILILLITFRLLLCIRRKRDTEIENTFPLFPFNLALHIGSPTTPLHTRNTILQSFITVRNGERETKKSGQIGHVWIMVYYALCILQFEFQLIPCSPSQGFNFSAYRQTMKITWLHGSLLSLLNCLFPAVTTELFSVSLAMDLPSLSTRKIKSKEF